jgi:SAM-dependent methyltransferase
LVHHYIANEQTLVDPNKPMRVLHVAPERGIAEWLTRRSVVEYLAGDLTPERYDFVPAVRVDVARLQFADAQFDLLICNHVLEHVPDDRLAMRELFRVLRPGGQAILQVPISDALTLTREDPAVTEPHERERMFGQADHVRIYGRDYSDRLSAAGFVVEVVNPGDRWGGETVHRLRLDPKERLYIGRRI